MAPRHRDIATLAAVLSLGAAAPAAAGEGTGGVAAPSGTGPAQQVTVAPGALLGRPAVMRGRVGREHAGARVRVERHDPGRGWRAAGRAVVRRDGSFAAKWRPTRLGRTSLRALLARPGASSAAAPLTTQVTVYRPAIASWYGPGFWGRRTACGMKLTRDTVGVAHKSLPCGTRVALYHRGRSVTVPVIDRGPFVRGREWDLTQAAAEAIGMRSTVRIGALRAARAK
jgi:hypothetical protein